MQQLQRSHIVPRFLIKAAGLLGGKFVLNCISDASFTENNRQDGIKEYLLCWNCEQRLQVWETYARKKIYGDSNPFKNINQNGVMWTGLEYAKMKLFVVSIIWRMSISSHPFYQAVNLGSKHENIIREMLLKQEPRERWRYGCSLGVLYYGVERLPPVFSQPQRYLDIHGRNAYRLILAGFLVYMDAASHPPPADEQEHYLQPNGLWIVPSIQALSVGFVKAEIDLVRKVYGTIP